MSKHPKSLQLTAQLIQVGRPITAEPGQYLIVVAGLCVGIYTGEPGLPLADTPPASVTPWREAASRAAALAAGASIDTDPPAPKLSKSGRKQRKDTGKKRGPYNTTGTGTKLSGGGILADGRPVSTVIPAIKLVLRVLAEQEEVRAGDLYSLADKDTAGAGGWRVRDGIAWLRYNEVITKRGNAGATTYARGPKFDPEMRVDA